jgi:hypothetical protein
MAVQQIGLKLDEQVVEALREWALQDRRSIQWEIKEAITLYIRTRNAELFAEPTTYFGSALTPGQREKVSAEPDRQKRIDMIKEFVRKNTDIDAPVAPEAATNPSSVTSSAAMGEASPNVRPDATSDAKEGSESKS